MKTAVSVLFLIQVLLFTACTTDYPAKAVENAREFALKDCRELSEYQRHFIRYREPVIMRRVIFSNSQTDFLDLGYMPTRFDKERLVDPQYDFMHTAIVWEIPEQGGYVVVDGTSLRNMMFWEAGRVVRKQFVKDNPFFDSARLQALNLVLGSLPDITSGERHHIRFAKPDVRVTTFSVEPAKKLEDAKKKGGWMEYLKAAAEEEEPCQISMIWPIPGKEHAIVVCGFSMSRSLADWKPETVIIVSKKDLNKNIVARENPLK